MNIYDDSVLKLSIKQGTESDRFPVSLDNANSLDYKITSELPGSFTMAEPVFTRDTNRIFIGNFTTNENYLYNENGHQKIQQTLGGVLSGNKYLGFFDSKPPYNNSEDDSQPLPLAEDKTYTINNEEITYNGCLLDKSKFRTYNQYDKDGFAIKTEDGKWAKQSYYNPKYDAYDGDYMYDIYRNALIIFDHNIKPTDGDLSGKSRLQSKIDAIYSESEDSPRLVYKHTKDMYGDGYVCLYNVIPDGDTLSFEERDFNTETGVAETSSQNYTQNIIRVQKVYAPAIENALDSKSFELSSTIENDAEVNVMKLKPSQYINEIYLEKENEFLSLPKNIKIDDKHIDYKPFIIDGNISPDSKYVFEYQYNLDENILNGTLAPKESSSYIINLGEGLCTASGDNKVMLGPNTPVGSIVFSGNITGSESKLTNNPYSLSDTFDTYSYTSNLAISPNGKISSVNAYSNEYIQKAEKIVNLYDNVNTSTNYLNTYIPLFASKTGVNEKFVFNVEPIIYCSNITSKDSAYDVVGVNEKITISNEKGLTTTLVLDDLRAVKLYCEDNKPEFGDDVTKVEKKFYISNSLYSYTPIYTKNTVNTPANIQVITVSKDTGLTIEEKVGEDGVKSLIIDNDPCYSIYFERVGEEITSLDDLQKYFPFTQVTEVEGKRSINIKGYHTNELDEAVGTTLEVTSSTGLKLYNLEEIKYFTNITLDPVTLKYNCPELSDIKEVIVYYTSTSWSVVTGTVPPAINYSTEYKSKSFTNDDIPIGPIGSSIIDAKDSTHIYMIELISADNKYIFNLKDFINYSKTSDMKYSAEDGTPTYKAVSPYVLNVYYTPHNTDYDSFAIDKTYYLVEFIEDSYYLTKDFNIRGLIDAEALYYYYDENNLRRCLGDTGEIPMTDLEEEEWVDAREVEVLSAFPIVPTHATSIILECKCGGSSDLSITYIGNNKDNSISELDGITFGGVMLPNTVGTGEGFSLEKTQDKILLSISNNSTEYLELPIAINENGIRHITCNIEASGKTLISLAGYKV